MAGRGVRSLGLDKIMKSVFLVHNVSFISGFVERCLEKALDGVGDSLF